MPTGSTCGSRVAFARRNTLHRQLFRDSPNDAVGLSVAWGFFLEAYLSRAHRHLTSCSTAVKLVWNRHGNR